MTAFLLLASCVDHPKLDSSTDTGTTPSADSATTGDTGDSATTSNDTPADPNSPYADCESVREEDWYEDGRIESTLTVTYDEHGNYVSVDYAEDEGGRSYHDTYSWNSDGSMSVWTNDEGRDGQVDTVWTYFYEEGGLRTRVDVDDGDGETDAQYLYDYGDDDLVDSVEYDYALDGAVDALYVYVWTDLPDGGLRESRSYDAENDGRFDAFQTEDFDADGNEVAWTEDTDGDGLTDEAGEFVRDADGVILESTIIGYEEGEEALRFEGTYSYDAWLRYDHILYDFVSPDLSTAMIYEYTWTCF